MSASNGPRMGPRRLAASRRPNLSPSFPTKLAPRRRLVVAALALFVATTTQLAAAQQPQPPTCADADGDGNSFCTLTPGYKLKTTRIADPSVLTIANCCERDDSKAAFAACDSAGSGGAGLGGVQAPVEGDTSWIFQDGAGFAQHLDRFTGLCFSILINPSDCTDAGDPLAAPKCCTKKPPSAMQIKIATPSASSVQAGSKRAGALANLSKCGIAWASGTIASTRGLKRVTKWERVAATDSAQYFNVPLAFPAKARQATFCLYTNNAVDAASDCTWESICGLKDGTVPFASSSSNGGIGALDNEYAQGCEIRLVGKKAPATSQCCSPPMSLVSFDSEVLSDDDGGGAPVAAAARVAAGGDEQQQQQQQAVVASSVPPSAALAVPEGGSSSSNVIRARRVGGGAAAAADGSSSSSSGSKAAKRSAVVLRRGRSI